MLNVIGSADGDLATTLRPVARALAMPRASVHWYGKSPPKPRRKMGHLNVIAESAAAAAAALLSLQGEGEAPPAAPRVGVIMGSDSDLGCMRAAAEVRERTSPTPATLLGAGGGDPPRVPRPSPPASFQAATPRV